MGLELSMTEQGLVFLFSCAVGVFLGAFYDVFRIIRIAFNSKWLSVFFQDFIFCIFSALSVILLVFYTNSGIVRWFSLVGCFASFMLYHLTVGRIIMLAAKKIIDFIKKILYFIRSITIVPAKKLIMLILKLIKNFSLFMFAQLKRAKKYLYYANKKNAAKRGASRGFNLYKAGPVSKTVQAEIKSGLKKLAETDRTQKKELAGNRKKTREYKKSSKKTQSLGSLKSLNSIKFK